MKILTYLVTVLLIAALGAGAYFYVVQYQPATSELAKFRAGQPEYDRARKELRRYQEQEKAASGWIGPIADSLRKGLAAEIAAGTAEVAVTGSGIIVNIAESALYTPKSVTFARNSQPLQMTLAALLKDIRDREILVGNTAQSVPAQGRGRRRVPARDGRALAASRSQELVKALIRNGVPDESLVAAAYPAKPADRGFRIKGDRTIIVISAPAAITAVLPTAAAPRPAPTAAAPSPSSPQQQKPLPIGPAPQKKVP